MNTIVTPRFVLAWLFTAILVIDALCAIGAYTVWQAIS